MRFEDISFDQILAVHKKLRDMAITHWMNHEVFGVFWWVYLFLAIIPWIVWWKIRDENRTFEIFDPWTA